MLASLCSNPFGVLTSVACQLSCHCSDSIEDEKNSESRHQNPLVNSIPSIVTVREEPTKSAEPRNVTSHLRIFHFSDCYIIDNLPILADAVRTLSAEVPDADCMTVCAGDFLAPSLLSSIDHGCGMIDMMNAIPVDVVCFGNHEGDVPLAALVDRMDEFGGAWLNSNLPPQIDPNNRCVDHLEVKTRGGRSVVMLGFCVGGGKDMLMYRPGAFGGHAKDIIPVIESLPGAVVSARYAFPNADALIPLTHQSMSDDIAFAKVAKARGYFFPCILAGHDHEPEFMTVEGMRIAKPGSDAYWVNVVDLKWDSSQGPRANPSSVTMNLRPLARPPSHMGVPPSIPFKMDLTLLALSKQKLGVLEELNEAIMCVTEPGALSSVGVRFGPSTMATFLASRLRDAKGADCCLMNAGSVRGNKTYDSGEITFADLKTEVPFPTNLIIIQIGGDVLSRAVEFSRHKWLFDPPQEFNSALHCDDQMVYNAVTGMVETVGDLPLGPETLYTLVIDSFMLNANKNKVLSDYATDHPERIPPHDSGLPPLPTLASFFCYQLWREIVDVDGDGNVNVEEVAQLLDLKLDPYKLNALMRQPPRPSVSSTAKPMGSEKGTMSSKSSPRLSMQPSFDSVFVPDMKATWESNKRVRRRGRAAPRYPHGSRQLEEPSNEERMEWTPRRWEIWATEDNPEECLDESQLAEIIEAKLGPRRASRLVVKQCFALADKDKNGRISKQELCELLVQEGKEQRMNCQTKKDVTASFVSPASPSVKSNGTHAAKIAL